MPSPFEPFAPEMLADLKPDRQKRLQRLEAVLTKLSGSTRGPRLEKVYQSLLAMHERIGNHLVARMEKKARRQGKISKVKKIVSRFRTAQVATRMRRGERRDDRSEVRKIEDAFAAGKISQAQRDRLMQIAKRT